MKKMFFLILSVAFLVVLMGCNETDCDHNYTLIDSKASSCTEMGYDTYQCQDCKESYKEWKNEYSEHTYSNNYTCCARACINEGCVYVEKASTEHTYTQEYICRDCETAKNCTLEIIGADFSSQILERARKNAGDMIGDFSIVVLDSENTILNLQNYIIAPQIDVSKITAGLFVKFDVTLGGTETLFTIYYNFGLQFSEEQIDDLAFTYDGSNEIWFLEVVEGNKTILFEYSIV